MTPSEFDAACRQLERKFPDLSATSGRRSVERNAAVGGNPASKHVIGMARDFVGEMEVMREAALAAGELGLWFVVHDKGSGDHLHVQGLPPGEVPGWWVLKYGE